MEVQTRQIREAGVNSKLTGKRYLCSLLPINFTSTIRHQKNNDMKLLLFVTFVLLQANFALLSAPYSCDETSNKYAFCNKKLLPISMRVRTLVSLLTLDEKISQLVNSAAAIPRLGVPPYEWWSEALHGISDSGRGVHFQSGATTATSFPQVILTAASFDASQWYRIGQAIGREARALYNAGQTTGMTFWAPNINIFRDPRWGRGQETPGEDPLVTGEYATFYVRGIQGDSFQGGSLNGDLQASACCKHFTAYDLDHWKGTNRFVFDAHVSLQDLADTYQPPFQSCIQQGRASGIMCSYNRVNGVPNCANFGLLTKTARAQWGFNGYITSDCDAVSIIHDNQGYAKSPEDAVVDVLKAGMDVNCGSYLQQHAKAAVEQGKLPVEEIDRALRNLFSVRMRLGLFDGSPKEQTFGNIGLDQVCSNEHQNLALEAARSGIVLLKNSWRNLPLPKLTFMSVAVIGPNANSAKVMLGNYAGPPCRTVTPFQGIQKYARNSMFVSGCGTVECSSADIYQAVELAKRVDHVVMVMGLDQTQEREDFDRVDLLLPGKQEELIINVAKASKKPVTLVLLSGGPIDIYFATVNPKIGSILWAGYPGEAGGTAIAQIIFGDHNPGGRLPVTWYRQEFTAVPMTDMRMRADPASGYPGRTYRFYTGKALFKFGYGLSYTAYSYRFNSVTGGEIFLNHSASPRVFDDLRSRYMFVSELGTDLCEASKVHVRVGVVNHGSMAGKHPVLLFAEPAVKRKSEPIKQLVAFDSVVLSAGESGEVAFEISPCDHLSQANKNGLMVLGEGAHLLVVEGDEHPIFVSF